MNLRRFQRAFEVTGIPKKILVIVVVIVNVIKIVH